MTGPAMTAEELDALRGEFDIIPLVRRMSADTITPVGAFIALAPPDAEAFLLESVERGEAMGRYSFLGVEPRRRMSFPRGSSPAAALRSELRALRVYGAERLPPFFGGAVGWFGYATAGWTEELPDSHPDDLVLPDAELLFFDHVVAFDHVRQELILIANLFADDQRSSLELLRVAEERLTSMVGSLASAGSHLLTIPGSAESVELVSNVTRQRFLEMVGEAKDEITAGEIFQIVLSQRWETEFPEDQALTLYRVLRSTNPSPYMFLLRTRECTLVGTSPEMLVRLSADGVVETRPIAGTRPRGTDAAHDAMLAGELRADPKEMAEHLMLVDLGRNDVGRVAETASVEVTRFAEVERYSHVMHMVSDVRAKLKDGMSAIDLFLSAFPAGTVSGAPKIRAMQLIDRIEPTRRGPYAGAVAYFGFGGTLDSCIAIRTITLRGGRALIQAGAGIVHDSVPEREYQETVSKSAALRRAVELASALVRRDRAIA